MDDVNIKYSWRTCRKPLLYDLFSSLEDCHCVYTCRCLTVNTGTLNTSKMFMLKLIIYVYIIVVYGCTAWETFCPVISPSNELVFFTETPSKIKSDITKTQCTLECLFYYQDASCGDCRCFNYNSTSRNCSLFYYEPVHYDVDQTLSTTAYEVRPFWKVIAA